MSVPRSPPAWALIGRLIWMMLGPPALLLAAASIAFDGDGWFTLKDLAFFLVLGLVLGGRWLEHIGGSPMTTTGEPATSKDLQKYLVLTTLVAVVVWVLANIVGNHLS